MKCAHHAWPPLVTFPCWCSCWVWKLVCSLLPPEMSSELCDSYVDTFTQTTDVQVQAADVPQTTYKTWSQLARACRRAGDRSLSSVWGNIPPQLETGKHFYLWRLQRVAYFLRRSLGHAAKPAFLLKKNYCRYFCQLWQGVLPWVFVILKTIDLVKKVEGNCLCFVPLLQADKSARTYDQVVEKGVAMLLHYVTLGDDRL